MKCVLFFITALAAIARAGQSSPDSLTTPPAVISENTAYTWAAAGTLGPVVAGTLIGTYTDTETGIALITLGLLIGPSLGQYYAESYRQGNTGLAIRGLGGILILTAIASGPNTHHDLIPMYGIAMAGAAYSFIDTHFAVKRARERANEKAGTQRLGFSPGLFPASNGSLMPGVMARVTF